MMNKINKTGWLTLILTAALAGCGTSGDSVESFVQDSMNAPPNPLPAIPKIRAHVPVPFAGNGIDPFHLTIKKSGVDENAPDKDRAKERLENIPLDTMKFIGTVDRFGKMYAMIRADGIVHIVKPGNHLGVNYGEIVSIDGDKIILNEKIEDASGKWADKETYLVITPDDVSSTKKR